MIMVCLSCTLVFSTPETAELEENEAELVHKGLSLHLRRPISALDDTIEHILHSETKISLPLFPIPGPLLVRQGQGERVGFVGGNTR